MKIHLDSEIARCVKFQNYDLNTDIKGVFYHKLKKHRALEGWFMEYLRLEEGKISGLKTSMQACQISFSSIAPERINAFHLHPKAVQDELWCLLQGTIAVWLVDVRKSSTTLGVKQKWLLSGEEPGLLHIPSGVAHGYKAGKSSALLVYVMNNQFDPQDPNEGRLPWNYFGAELWEEDKG